MAESGRDRTNVNIISRIDHQNRCVARSEAITVVPVLNSPIVGPWITAEEIRRSYGIGSGCGICYDSRGRSCPWDISKVLESMVGEVARGRGIGSKAGAFVSIVGLCSREVRKAEHYEAC